MHMIHMKTSVQQTDGNQCVSASRVLNLTFHGVGKPHRALEPGEESVWVAEAKFLAILDAIRDHPDVHITFDDGNATDAEIALPALIARGLTADFCVVAGRLDAPGYLSRRQVRELATAAMRIGSHGMFHRPWSRLAAINLREELVDAREVLQGVVGRAVSIAACPFGSYDRRVLKLLRRAGYTRVYTSDGGRTDPGAWLQPRNTVQTTDSFRTIERMLDDRHPRALRILKAAKLLAKRYR